MVRTYPPIQEPISFSCRLYFDKKQQICPKGFLSILLHALNMDDNCCRYMLKKKIAFSTHTVVPAYRPTEGQFSLHCFKNKQHSSDLSIYCTAAA